MHQGTLLLYRSNLVCLTQKYNKQTLFCCWLFKSYERGLRKEKFLLVFHRKETINICSRKISYFWWWQLFVDVELIVEERSAGGEGMRRWWAAQVQNEIESDDEEIEFSDLTHKVAIDDSISTSAATILLLYKSCSEECCSCWRRTPSWRTRSIMQTGTPSLSSLQQDGCSDLFGVAARVRMAIYGLDLPYRSCQCPVTRHNLF